MKVRAILHPLAFPVIAILLTHSTVYAEDIARESPVEKNTAEEKTVEEKAVEEADAVVDEATSENIADVTEEEIADDDDFVLDETEEADAIVTTTARAPISAFSSDRSISASNENEILASGQTNLAGIADEYPGVAIQTTNPGADTVYIRGMIGPENLIYVDGVRFNQSTFRTGPNQYLSTIDPWAIRRMEIMRGPGSSLYGSGAMGGVIHVFPHQVPDKPLALRGLGMFRSTDTSTGAALDIGGQPDNLGVIAGFSVRNYGQLHTGQREGSNPTFAGAEKNHKMLASDYSEMFWRAAARADITDNSSFRLNYMGGMINDAPRTDNLSRADIRFTDNRDDLLWATYEYGSGYGALSNLTANVSFHRTHESTDRYKCHATNRPDGSAGRVIDMEGCAKLRNSALKSRSINDDVVNTIGTSLTGVSHLSAIPLQLSWGGEHYQDRVLSNTHKSSDGIGELQKQARGNFVSGSTYASTGLFLNGIFSAFATGQHEIALQGGARVENFRATEPGTIDPDNDIKFSNTGVVGSLGLSYLYGMNAHVYLNWSQGYRAPNLQEATYIGDSGNFFEINNPDLGPERSDTFELGTKLDIPNIARLTAAAYVSLLSDRITRTDATYKGEDTFEGKQVQQRINADSAYYYGAELGARTTPYFGIHLYGNISYLDGAIQVDSEDARFQEGPLHSLIGSGDYYTNPRRLTPVEYLAGINFSLQSNWFAAFYIQGAGAQDKLANGDLKDLRICETTSGVLYKDVGQDCPGSAAWTTLNLRGGYHFEDLGRIDLSVENLMDMRYRNHGSGILAPGFGAMITLTVLQ